MSLIKSFWGLETGAVSTKSECCSKIRWKQQTVCHGPASNTAPAYDLGSCLGTGRCSAGKQKQERQVLLNDTFDSREAYFQMGSDSSMHWL